VKQKIRQARVKLSGLTLVEVLVVISVITLLMSIILPITRRARMAAYLVICQSQLRQWGVVFEGYSFANDGFYPHIDGLDRADGNADNFGWVDTLPPLMGEKRWRDYPIWHKPTKGIYQCPMAKPGSGYSYNPLRNGYFSYAMNSCLELDGSCWEPLNCPGGNNMPSFLNTALIKRPSRVILLFDQLLDPHKGYDGNQTYGDAGKYCGSYPKSFSARHFRKKDKLGGSILYCDYHVEWVESVWNKNWPEEMKEEDAQAPPRNDLNWYPY